MAMTPPPPPPPGGQVPPPPGAVPPPPGHGAYGTPPPPPPGYTGYAGYGTPASGVKASFWVRVGSSLLDSLLYGLVSLPFLIAGFVLIAQAFSDCYRFQGDDEIYCPPGEPKVAMIVLGAAVILAGIIVVAVLYLRALGRTGQTWGRRITNIKVVGKQTGQPIGVGRAFGRYAIQMVFGAAFFLPLLDVLWMLWDQDRQTLHDKVVDSVVIRV